MLDLDKTIGPHRGQPIIYTGKAIGEADSAMIMLHGRGADAESMKSLANEIDTKGIIYVIPQAADNSWYPYRFIEKREANEPGITSGLVLINSIVKALINKNFPAENIYLLGFSQGACLVSDYAARYPARFGGVFALSGGLIGQEINVADYRGDLQRTPVFFGCSDTDFHIPVARVNESAKIFVHLNADVTKNIYPNMGHTINLDEMNIVNQVIASTKFPTLINNENI